MAVGVPGTHLPLSEKVFELIGQSGKSSQMLRVMYGLQILASYPNSYITAEHDIIYAGPNEPEKVVSEQDRKDLERLGWHVDSGADVYARFV